MTIDREQLIRTAEELYRQEQERETRFEAYLLAHLGPSVAEQAQAIIRTPPAELPDDQLHLVCQFELGLDPGVLLSR